jgi:hypothetical protein
MCRRSQHGAKAERKKVGKEIHYRIFEQDKAVSVQELAEKLTPIIKALDAEGKKTAIHDDSIRGPLHCRSAAKAP